MAMGLKSVVICFVLVAALVQSSQAQTTHIVLDAMGWVIPQGGVADYDTWAAKQTFAVGDILLFNYATRAHDVAVVTKTAYESCAITNTISIETTGPTNITLTSAGEHYYICTVGTHCSLGQKLAVNVSSTTTNSTTPPPPGTTTASPPPPGGNTTVSPPPPSSTATPLAVAALPMITLLSIVLAMLH